MDVVLSEPTTSREHAAIVHHADGRLFLIDLASVRAQILHVLYSNIPERLGDFRHHLPVRRPLGDGGNAQLNTVLTPYLKLAAWPAHD